MPTCQHATIYKVHCNEPQQHHHTTTPHACRPRAAVRTCEIGIHVRIGCEQRWSRRFFLRSPSDEPDRDILQPCGMLWDTPYIYETSGIYVRTWITLQNRSWLRGIPKSRFLRNVILNTSYQKFPFGSGDDPDKLFLFTKYLYMFYDWSRYIG